MERVGRAAIHEPGTPADWSSEGGSVKAIRCGISGGEWRGGKWSGGTSAQVDDGRRASLDYSLTSGLAARTDRSWRLLRSIATP